MSARLVVRRIHLVAAVTAFLTVVTFWTATVLVELFGTHEAIAGVKGAVLWGMIILVPAIAAAGGTGFRLGGKSQAAVIVAKRRRMPLIAANGLLILVPSAFFLAGRAEAGQFDIVFYAVQAVELVAGAVNIGLMSLSMRAGLSMTRKRRSGLGAQAA